MRRDSTGRREIQRAVGASCSAPHPTPWATPGEPAECAGPNAKNPPARRVFVRITDGGYGWRGSIAINLEELLALRVLREPLNCSSTKKRSTCCSVRMTEWISPGKAILGMSISLTPFVAGAICHGCTWTVDDIDELATHIALVAVGQAEHAIEILESAGVASATADAWAVESALGLLTAAAADPFHRDGWMFQVMSWIAAHRGSSGAIIRAPHMRAADKGFDGLQVEIEGQSGEVAAVVIFEDKATERPRAMIRDEVWPDFRDLEKGANQNVLVAEITTLLKGAGRADAAAVVKKVVWSKSKHYRVSITVGQAHASEPGRSQLFSDFDAVAPGEIRRRRGETLHIPNLRPWLHDLAELTKSKVRAMMAGHV